MNRFKVTIVGAGLAGSEAALVLSYFDNVEIKLYEMRPNFTTEVHKTDKYCELVCSNSLKSLKFNSAAGMLKYELAALGSPLLKSYFSNRVKAGNALAVDRNKFADEITTLIKYKKNIQTICDEFVDIENEIKKCDALLLASGPLTSKKLANQLIKITGEEELSFYDAAAPIVSADSIDLNKVYAKDRYSNNNEGDYLNCPMSKQEYNKFINELISADCVIKKKFEGKDLFQACQPIEEVAKSGFDAPRYGTMKPIGLNCSNANQIPYAVVQLRSENKNKTAYNLVGFQTNLTFIEQKRVFSLIPGLENAEFVRFGVMHRNTFINSPKLLNDNLKLIDKNIFVCGQLSGTEGYVEAIRSGHHAALCIISWLQNIDIPKLPIESAFGALIKYATCSETKKYQPMHVNFGIMPTLNKTIRNKQERYKCFAIRGIKVFDSYVNKLKQLGLIVDEHNIEKLKFQINKLWI